MPIFFKSKSPRRAEPKRLVDVPADVLRPTGSPPAFDNRALERRIGELGRSFLEHARGGRSGFLSTAFWSDKLMDWAMKDQAFKVQLFRFVDAFPSLKSSDQVHDHLVDYLTQPGVTPPPGLGMGLKAGGMLKGTMTKTITSQISSMASRFIAGTDAASAVSVLKNLWTDGTAFTISLLGEKCLSRNEADRYQEKYLALVRDLTATAVDWPAAPRLERDHLGPLPRVNISVKISSLYPHPDPVNTDRVIDGLAETLLPILDEARQRGAFVNFDIEQLALKDLTLELFKRCAEVVDTPMGVVLQAYLRCAEDDARELIEWTKRTGRLVGVRLVKGAYWDYETIHAEQTGHPVPVWSRKEDTDACFERVTKQLVDATPRTAGDGGVRPAIASHNVRSIATAMALVEDNDLPPEALELQMLYGMGDQLKTAALRSDMRLREYVPIGEMIPGMAYLVRRLLENTSNESWLRAGFMDNASADLLLASPHQEHTTDPGHDLIASLPERHELSPADEGVGNGRPFFNETRRDFAHRQVRDSFASAVARAQVPPAPAPANDDAVVRAYGSSRIAIERWTQTPMAERAAVLSRAADVLAQRRDEIAGMVIRTVGMTWYEADAEVCRAIDLLRYNARCVIDLAQAHTLGQFVGEENLLTSQPIGTALIIGSWRRPVSTLLGTAGAAIVTGNPVLLSAPPVVAPLAQVVLQTLLDAGCGADLAQLLPAPNTYVYESNVEQPSVTFLTSPTGGTGEWVHCFPAEVEGKSIMLVDASADVDESVLGVQHAAFAHQGQAPAACALAIVHDNHYDVFIERLCEATAGRTFGDPIDPSVSVAPLISRDGADVVRAAVERAKDSARLALAEHPPAELASSPNHSYIGPHILADLPRDVAVDWEEIPGPVLAVARAESFDDAIAIANESMHRTAVGVFSRKPTHLQMARERLRSPAVFLNMAPTDALVGRQPTGLDGPLGLSRFVQTRIVAENTLRSGFAPGLDA